MIWLERLFLAFLASLLGAGLTYSFSHALPDKEIWPFVGSIIGAAVSVFGAVLVLAMQQRHAGVAIRQRTIEDQRYLLEALTNLNNVVNYFGRPEISKTDVEPVIAQSVVDAHARVIAILENMNPRSPVGIIALQRFRQSVPDRDALIAGANFAQKQGLDRHGPTKGIGEAIDRGLNFHKSLG